MTNVNTDNTVNNTVNNTDKMVELIQYIESSYNRMEDATHLMSEAMEANNAAFEIINQMIADQDDATYVPKTEHASLEEVLEETESMSESIEDIVYSYANEVALAEYQPTTQDIVDEMDIAHENYLISSSKAKNARLGRLGIFE